MLSTSERRGRITPASVDACLDALAEAPITIDMIGIEESLAGVLNLCRALPLTAYDAAYLELAMRLRAPLATFDERLAAAAAKLNVQIL